MGNSGREKALTIAAVIMAVAGLIVLAVLWFARLRALNARPI
jgi:hypothetical protein